MNEPQVSTRGATALRDALAELLGEIEQACRGTTEWRVANAEGAYCIGFTTDSDLNPKRAAETWMKENAACVERCGYTLQKARSFSQAESLANRAAAMLATISGNPLALASQLSLSPPPALNAAMDNVLAWRLGMVAGAAKDLKGGDYIDTGLGLLRLLTDSGFEVRGTLDSTQNTREALRVSKINAVLSPPPVPTEPTPESNNLRDDVLGILRRWDKDDSYDLDTCIRHLRSALASQPAPQPAPAPEIRRNEDGTPDEVVASGAVHLEQMSPKHWWMGIDNPAGEGRITVSFHSKAAIKAYAENEGWPQADSSGSA